MGCGDEKLSKYLTQIFTAHCNAMICQQVTLSGDAEWPKVADAVIEAAFRTWVHDSHGTLVILWYLISKGCCCGTASMVVFARSSCPSATSIQTSSSTSGS